MTFMAMMSISKLLTTTVRGLKGETFSTLLQRFKKKKIKQLPENSVCNAKTLRYDKVCMSMHICLCMCPPLCNCV